MVRLILADARPYWRRAFLCYLCLFSVIGLNMAIPWLIKEAIDVGLGRGDRAYLAFVALVILGVSAVRSLFSLGQRYLQQSLAQHVAYDLRNQLFDKLQHLSFSFHDHAESGQLLTRVTADVEAEQRFLSAALFQVVALVVIAVTITAIMVTQNLKLALLSLLAIPPVGVLALFLARHIRPLWRQVQRTYSDMSNTLQENLLGAHLVRAYAREPYEIQKFDNAHRTLLWARMRTMVATANYQPMMLFLIAMPTAIVLYVGGRLAIAGELTIGTVVAFNGYLALLAGPVQNIGNLVTQLTEAVVSRQRIQEVLNTVTDVVEKPNARELPPVSGHVRFDHVSLTYPGSTHPALEDITLEALPGQVIALVGHTGAGKTSLINLLPRFYEVTSGSITIDGIDIRDVTLESLRRQVGMVLQTTFLFSATVHENIAFGRPDATREEVIEVAKAARAHEFIMDLPDGYDTVIGERGLTLSGGQRQRIAIARALLIKPPILILDDSTSSVDMHTEHLIQQALAVLMKGRTSFVIAQRLTTVKNADQILVMHHGRIAERGTHDELLAQGGLYREIYDLQLRDQEEAARLAA